MEETSPFPHLDRSAFSTASLSDPPNERYYWFSKSPEERLEAIEIMQAGKQSAAAIGGQPIQGRKQITHLDAGKDWACVEYDTQAIITGLIAIREVTVIPEEVNRTVVSKACVVFQMKNGKIDRAREYFDALPLARRRLYRN